MIDRQQQIISSRYMAISSIEAEFQKLSHDINQLCKEAQFLIAQEADTYEGELLLKSKQIQLMIAQKKYNGHKKKRHKKNLFI